MSATPQIVTAAGPTREVSQNPERYCYYCRRKHPADQPMRRIETACGIRWRCKASIDATRQDAASRNAWGRAMTDANKSQNRRSAEHINKLRQQSGIA